MVAPSAASDCSVADTDPSTGAPLVKRSPFLITTLAVLLLLLGACSGGDSETTPDTSDSDKDQSPTAPAGASTDSSDSGDPASDDPTEQRDLSEKDLEEICRTSIDAGNGAAGSSLAADEQQLEAGLCFALDTSTGRTLSVSVQPVQTEFDNACDAFEAGEVPNGMQGPESKIVDTPAGPGVRNAVSDDSVQLTACASGVLLLVQTLGFDDPDGVAEATMEAAAGAL